MTEAHGGNLRKLSELTGIPINDISDFSANINPLGPPEDFREAIGMQIGSLVHYPDPDCTDITAAFAKRYRIAEDEIAIGNGSTELLYLLPHILRKTRAVIPVPAYADYERAAELAGLAVKRFFLHEKDGFALDFAALDTALAEDDILFIGRPNNPTGNMPSAAEIKALAGRHPEMYIISDEAFADFAPEKEALLAPKRAKNIIILKSLTKFYAMPGLRLGAVVAEPHIIRLIKERMLPWSVNALAQAAGAAALRNRPYINATRRFVAKRRRELHAALERLPGLKVYPSEANFLLIRSNQPALNAPELSRRLLARGIAIRVCDNFAGLDQSFLRIAVRSEKDNERLIAALTQAMGIGGKKPAKRQTPAIMFQGTSSNAGKSILAAAFCRIMLQDGIRVAPFKAQNMSLNSYVTRDGGEIGRAQAMQAQASRIEPDVRMNPVLLKPSSDNGSQVIVLGKPIGVMDFGQYIGRSGSRSTKMNPKLRTVRRAYDSLAAEYDAIVLEGAGSPAEVNLKKRDIVNMSMALYAHAPVLIVGDIDRGGVYASFIGTMECLTEEERAIVKGFIVNRFRGEESFLASAHRYVLKKTGIPVRGVIPYLPDLGLPEEDSVSFKSAKLPERMPGEAHVAIAVIDLPHISNFTDFDPFKVEPDVSLYIVRRIEELGEPDAVILPGSKNVIGDLEALRICGLSDGLMRISERGKTEIIGVCGGFQMMGIEIADPLGIESTSGRSIAGLGLLPVRTELASEKTLKRAAARHLPSGCLIRGYEIHHGLTESGVLPPQIIREDGKSIGVGTENGLLWGTYLHGIFDDDRFRRWLIDRLRIRKGLKPVEKIVTAYDLEPAFDRLAEVVRQSVNMEEIYKIIGI
jgi:cobyric acid synthase CobQ/L-threonine-O-3-phosphate decarboxylase